MSYFQNHSPRILLAILFLFMLALAASISIIGSNIPRRILVVLIPFSAVILGAVSTTEAQSNVKMVSAILLIISGFAATTLAVIGAGPFSNSIVDVAIIGGIVGIKYSQPIQTTVQTAQRLVN